MAWRPLNVDDLLGIARNMRDSDRREIFATRFDNDIASLVTDLLASDPLGGIMLTQDGAAVAAIGASEMWPGNWALWMFATDRWPEVAMEATRFARGTLQRALLGLGGRRAECRSIDGHFIAHRWLGRLGAEAEAVYPGFGRNGETFIGFVFHAHQPPEGIDMCGLLSPKPRPVEAPKPVEPIEVAATDAADQEMRRLRALNGRRSTILTPEPGKLGAAPTGNKGLLGS